MIYSLNGAEKLTQLVVKITNLKIDGITKGPQVCFGKTKEFNIPLLKKYFNIE